MKNNLRKLMLFFALAVGSLLFSASANAYTNGRLIDNQIFDNTNGMTEAQIRSFINERPGTCLVTSGAAFPEPQDYWTYGPNNVDAARVIYKAAQYSGVNPQVIIATLQKEQSLITDNDCLDPEGFPSLPKAMGMGCFEGQPCPTEAYRGFEKQVMKGTWLLAFGRHRAEGNVGWGGNDSITYGGPMTQGTFRRCGSCSLTYFDGYRNIDGQPVFMENGATATMYNYTPHLGQSFPGIFEGWFGPSTIYLVKTVNDPRIYLPLVSKKLYVPSPAVMSAWGLDTKPITIVSQAYLDSLTDGGTLSTLAKKSSDNQNLYLINSRNHYKVGGSCSDWGLDCLNDNIVKAIPASLIEEQNYGGSLPAMLANGGTVYKLEAGAKRPVLDVPTWNSLGGPSQTRSMQDINAQQPLGSLLLSNNTLIQFQGNPTIFLYDTGNLHAIPGPQELKAWGLDKIPVAIVPGTWQTGLTQGTALGVIAADASGAKYLLDDARRLSLAGSESHWPATGVVGFGEAALFRLPSVGLKPIQAAPGGPIFTVFNGQKYIYPTFDDFFGLGASLSNVGNISSFTASLLPFGGFHLASGRLYKVDNNPHQIYRVNGSNSLYVNSTNYPGLPYDKLITVDPLTAARYPVSGTYTP